MLASTPVLPVTTVPTCASQLYRVIIGPNTCGHDSNDNNSLLSDLQSAWVFMNGLLPMGSFNDSGRNITLLPSQYVVRRDLPPIVTISYVESSRRQFVSMVQKMCTTQMKQVHSTKCCLTELRALRQTRCQGIRSTKTDSHCYS